MTRPRLLRWAAVLAVALAVASACPGCRAGSSGQNPAKIHITYSQTGGIAGISKSISVTGGGKVTVTSGSSQTTGTEFTVSPQDVGRLAATLESAGYFSYEDKYAPPMPVSDSLTERVTYDDGKKIKEVAVVTGAQPPQGWDEIVKRINALGRTAGK